MSTKYRFYIKNPEALSLADIVERLGAIIAYYRGTSSSAYERTKEVWSALKTLLRLSEKMWNEWIPIIAERYTLGSGSTKDIEYFKQLLRALLEKFSKEVKGYNPSVKTLLAKSIRSAIDSASRYPYPQLCFFVKEFHPDRLCDKRFKDTCEEVLSHECK